MEESEYAGSSVSGKLCENKLFALARDYYGGVNGVVEEYKKIKDTHK